MAESKKTKKMVLICSKGTMEWVFATFFMATTAAAMDVQVSIFFTFYGLDAINKKKYKNLKVAPIANPAMPMPIPVSMPNIIGMLPGMTAMGTMVMKKMMKDTNQPDLIELIDMSIDLGIKFIACSNTVEMTGLKLDDFVDGTTIGGAAEMINLALDADIQLFV